jgi:hypothetical protein
MTRFGDKQKSRNECGRMFQGLVKSWNRVGFFSGNLKRKIQEK